ncbi:uncharacterized protein LOC6547532 isoform X1 [Drosophila erecta]|uniref:uncharacterized protein LOC6547532 isoform X1 n=1 Tax=Drosophila erecta TaxID=7220 RepID=UPI0001780BDD|nr:uncharacterized protein LOC6547532 isoform X1 [Drosophila erecta]
MKLLFFVFLFICLVVLVLVEASNGFATSGAEEPKFDGLFRRARRHVPEIKSGLLHGHEPPPPPKFRSLRNALEGSLVATDDNQPPSQVRQRRQAPPGMPPPPDGLPPPPQFLL